MNESLTSWLYRPYIDLTPEAPEGNPQTKGLLLALDSVEHERERARIHGFYPGARRQILHQSRLPAYALEDPRELPVDLRTPGWEMLCDQLNELPGASKAQRARVLWLLHRLHLHRAGMFTSAYDSETYFLRGMSRIAVAVVDELPPDKDDLQVAAAAPPGEWGGIEATYLLAAIAAKVEGEVESVRHWAAENRRLIDPVEDEHDRAKLLSRYHRVVAFVPQLERDLVGMARQMDHAQEYAEQMKRDSEDHETEAHTLAFALWESRTKEALIEGDLDLALERAWKAVAESPLRPAGYLALGQVQIERKENEDALASYRTAGRLGPSDNDSAAPALFMAGQCLEKLDEPEAAADAYLSALDADPLGTASLEQLIVVSENDSILRRWAEDRLNEIGHAQSELQPYQYEGSLGR